ncbi:hypothetical protein CEXT_706151 [Caerostris extrusa]|uniref:Uncharacterized protein n=1 Tax=Caerostris extrusa TaxID=172846 RepID=A0AAV4XFK3_CAEEX|nr:hypothetical protein CEXT_706151 [Caerostris extrusa]
MTMDSRMTHDRDDGDHAGGLRALRVFEQEPHLLLELLLRQGLLLLLDETLVLPELVEGHLPQLVELDLLGEHVRGTLTGLRRRPRSGSSREWRRSWAGCGRRSTRCAGGRSTGSGGGVAQQAVRELVERPKLGLEPEAGDVDHHPLAEVVVVRDGLEVAGAGALGLAGLLLGLLLVCRRAAQLLAAQLRKRPGGGEEEEESVRDASVAFLGGGAQRVPPRPQHGVTPHFFGEL